MSNCEKRCFVESCPRSADYYVNYTRYHGLCVDHEIELGLQNIDIFCQFCRSSLKIISELQ